MEGILVSNCFDGLNWRYSGRRDHSTLLGTPDPFWVQFLIKMNADPQKED
jgi:hypothetical protein